MNWADLLDWMLRILGGLAALVGLALFVTLLGNIGKVFAWLGKSAWWLAKWFARLVRSPRQALLEAVDHSTLFTFSLFLFTWLYEKLWLRPRLTRRSRQRNPGQPSGDHKQSTGWPEPPPWNKAPSLASLTKDAPSRPVPAQLTELLRLWENGFDIQPIRDIPSSESFYMSYYVYPQLWEPDAPSILVENTTPYNDQRWRLAMQSGKDVLCIEIDEAEFLAWWLRTLFNDKGELDMPGWLRVSELTIGYCETHGYPNWRFMPDRPSPEEQQRWHDGLVAELAAYHDAVLYARDAWSASRVALWREEIVARYGPLHAPERNWVTNELRPVQSGWAGDFALWLEESHPIRLIDLLKAEDGTRGLVQRLDHKSMPPYGRDELAQATSPGWVLAEDSSDPVCLLLESIPAGQGGETLKACFPKAWTESPDWPNQGPFLCLWDRYIVTNEMGLRGLLDLEGRFTVPCQYAYLHEGKANGACFEAATTLEPDSRGERLCDLIDGDGRRINPPGLKVLAGTLAHDGCVVAPEDDSQPLRLDWMDTNGDVRNGDALLAPSELRWTAVGNMSGGRRLVRSPDSGLWGYLDKLGAVAIPPAFHHASWFRDGLAKVGIAPGKLGLIGQDGAWRIPPVWADIWPESKQCYVAKNEFGEFGAINPADEIIVAFQTEDELLKDAPWGELKGNPRLALGEDFDPIELVMRQWRKNFLRKSVDEAKTQDSLASLEGVFDSNGSTRDLEEAGVWFMQVRLLRDKSEGLLRPKAGETGHIFAEYPTSLSIFNLSIEAPVAGLASAPESVVGISWRNLTAE